MAHKNFHTHTKKKKKKKKKTCVFTAPDTQPIQVGSHKLKLSKTFMPKMYKQHPPPPPAPPPKKEATIHCS